MFEGIALGSRIASIGQSATAVSESHDCRPAPQPGRRGVDGGNSVGGGCRGRRGMG